MSEVLEGREPTQEEKALTALFAEIEKGQIELLDGAAKRVIELNTGLLGVVFALTAFGNQFPPPYLQGNLFAKVGIVLTLICSLGATFFALQVVQPRDYSYNRYRLDEMRSTLADILRKKSWALRRAGFLFFCGSLALGFLIAALVLGA